ncbi:Eco57I restriction-modification methylase domain-containing protein [Streptomyces sp. C1-1]|uniref:Eco57I restriction-modification methylase domain-containing protein n=1 Tax=Streptomyces sp. C1-1 TaxID=3231173 RepID=UPI003D021037
MSATTRNQVFTAVHTVGGLLPADMLVRISEGKDVPGSKPADYGLPSSRSVRDEAERSWEYLKPLWRELCKRLPEDRETGVPASDPTGLAENDWLTPLWRELGFGRLTHIGAAGITADSDAEKKFPVSHRWHHALIHQAAWNAELDKRPGGAGTVPPQSMLQECLNRTEAHLWGVLTNGRQVRLLRDSSALATASYVEFDLEAIFDGELFSEFVLLYRLLHASRFEVAEGAAPSACWLEKWRTEAIASGTRALDQLRKGVQEAITALGTGFLRHPENTALRENVRPKPLQAALLRMVYRLLFVFVAEDRDALLSPGADDIARERYETYFSSARLRAHARKRRGTAHGDLYEALRIVLTALGDEKGRPELGLPGLGGLFNDTEADAPLRDLKLSNEALLTAVRHLSQVRDGSSGRWRAVDYRHLDAEELGSVYESLLELEPKYSAAERTFTLVEVAGNTRKTTGSYYTPSSLIECLLNSTLDPVIEDALRRGEEAAARSGAADPADAIVKELLSLTVCDPACGSGHFLVAAARRIAKQVAAVRERNPEPTLDAVRHALHEVVARCIYGVDLNPMAVDLAKVSLWLEALEPGKPLSFLDAHVKQGNSLVGATLQLVDDGVPDIALKPTEGDDELYCGHLVAENSHERASQLGLFETPAIEPSNPLESLARKVREITGVPADSLAQVHKQELLYREFSRSSEYQKARWVADAWCAAFVWHKTRNSSRPVTHETLQEIKKMNDFTREDATLTGISRLRSLYNFFHWYLEFPNIFSGEDGGSNGFHCILGNPPWDQVEVDDKSYFEGIHPEISEEKNSSRRKEMIADLSESAPELLAAFRAARLTSSKISAFVQRSGRFPLSGNSRPSTSGLFAETWGQILREKGMGGIIIPSGILTDKRLAPICRAWLTNRTLQRAADFVNKKLLFPDVAPVQRFSLITLSGGGRPATELQLAVMAQDVADLDTVWVSLDHSVALSFNPETGNLPLFSDARSARIASATYRRGTFFGALPLRTRQGFNNMTTSSADFLTLETLEEFDGEWQQSQFITPRGTLLLPVFESKLFDAFDTYAKTFDSVPTDTRFNTKAKPNESPNSRPMDYVGVPRYWIPEPFVEKSWPSVRRWCLVGKEVTDNKSSSRTSVFSILPYSGAGHTCQLVISDQRTPIFSAFLLANLNSFAFDFLVRQKITGSHLTATMLRQLPIAPYSENTSHSLIRPRVLELVYTTSALAEFARDLSDTRAPFAWSENRRVIIRAELDALFFHLYGVSREDADYILDTFPIVRRKDEAKYGSYRTKELILAEYDRMAAAGLTLENPLVDGENYTSTLTPPPGHGPRHPA